MKRLVLTTSALALLSGMVIAAPAQAGSINHRERAAIADSRHRLAVVKRQAWADGRLSLWDRFKIRNAEARYRRVVRSARAD